MSKDESSNHERRSGNQKRTSFIPDAAEQRMSNGADEMTTVLQGSGRDEQRKQAQGPQLVSAVETQPEVARGSSELHDLPAEYSTDHSSDLPPVQTLFPHPSGFMLDALHVQDQIEQPANGFAQIPASTPGTTRAQLMPGDAEVDSMPRGRASATLAEERAKQLRRERNRVAAAKCRRKKLLKLLEAESKNEILESKVERLKREIDMLEKTIHRQTAEIAASRGFRGAVLQTQNP